jgi:hypothetical protein
MEGAWRESEDKKETWRDERERAHRRQRWEITCKISSDSLAQPEATFTASMKHSTTGYVNFTPLESNIIIVLRPLAVTTYTK